ncbi:MAG: flagellar biosynthesis protein FlgA [Mycobacteriaceae bacterium]|nr:flagellar biosynthesis protein FlgA [Mycobacteriaceae bacterium]
MAEAERLEPTRRDRVAGLLARVGAHGVALRRGAAAGLAGLGLLLAVRGNPEAERVAVVVAARDLGPGRPLVAADVRVARREAAAVPPDGTFRDPQDLVGRTAAGPVRAGETVTDVRVVGSRLAAAATGDPDARVVPVRPADAGVAAMLHAGDRVDVIGAGDHGAEGAAKSAVLARDAVVVMVAEQDHARFGTRSGDRMVLLAMPARSATSVAGASLNSDLALVFH